MGQLWALCPRGELVIWVYILVSQRKQRLKPRLWQSLVKCLVIHIWCLHSPTKSFFKPLTSPWANCGRYVHAEHSWFGQVKYSGGVKERNDWSRGYGNYSWSGLSMIHLWCWVHRYVIWFAGVWGEPKLAAKELVSRANWHLLRWP